MYRSRKETRRKAQNDEKIELKEMRTREREYTAREREESSRNTLTISPTAAFGDSRVASPPESFVFSW